MTYALTHYRVSSLPTVSSLKAKWSAGLLPSQSLHWNGHFLENPTLCPSPQPLIEWCCVECIVQPGPSGEGFIRCVPIREASSFQRVLCTYFNGVRMCPY